MSHLFSAQLLLLYEEILNLVSKNLNKYARRWNNGAIMTQEEKERFDDKDFENSERILECYKTLSAKIREYWKTLVIIEESK